MSKMADYLIGIDEAQERLAPDYLAWRTHLYRLEKWNLGREKLTTAKAKNLVGILDSMNATQAVDHAANQRAYLLGEALAGLLHFWSYTPLRGKVPTLQGWTSRPHSTPYDLELWTEAGHNLGLRTGAASGVYVVDIDGPTIPEHYPETVTVRTGRGYHLYYRHVPGLRNTRDRLGDGIDTRGDGGQVVAVGSIHPETGRIYQWVPGHSPEEMDLAEMPGWMVDALQ